MGDIVQFRPRVKTDVSHNRTEALMKGQLEVYTCNTCEEDFEVLFNDFPDKCPHCGRKIEWE